MTDLERQAHAIAKAAAIAEIACDTALRVSALYGPDAPLPTMETHMEALRIAVEGQAAVDRLRLAHPEPPTGPEHGILWLTIGRDE